MYQGYYPYGMNGMNAMNGMNFAGNTMKRGGIMSLFNRGSSAKALGGISKKFDWGSLLSNTQKTLNVINQAIPIYYQVKPMWNNAKVMFNIMNAVKDDGKGSKVSSNSQKNNNQATNNYQISPSTVDNQTGPQFFI